MSKPSIEELLKILFPETEIFEVGQGHIYVKCFHPEPVSVLTPFDPTMAQKLDLNIETIRLTHNDLCGVCKIYFGKCPRCGKVFYREI